MHYLYLSQYSSMIEFVNEYMHIEQIFYLLECIINCKPTPTCLGQKAMLLLLNALLIVVS
jgi:hypothetical protein